MAASRIDGNNIRKTLLPKVNEHIKNANFAPNRYRVQKVFVCAAVISQDEEVIGELLHTLPSWSTTQDKLDWQPDDESRRPGDVYQHLLAMSSKGRDCPTPDQYLLEEVGFSNNSNSIVSHSFRLSTLEVCNAAVPNLGYHIGATALHSLHGFEGKNEECDLWTKLFFQYLIEKDDDSPGIMWGGRRVPTAVVWHVQLDIVDTWLRRRPSDELKRKGRYGTFGQVVPELEAPPEKLCKGVHSSRKSKYRGLRYRDDRGGVWVAETRLPKEVNRKNKVSFGDYKSDYEAARAIDVAYFYYGKDSFNFPDTPELLKGLPSLGGLEVEEKLKAVKDLAKRMATKAPHPSTNPPSSPIHTACSLQEETMASPGFSRSDSRESDTSDESVSVVDGIPDYMFDNLIAAAEPFELNQVDDDQYEERTHSGIGIFDDPSATIMYSAALSPQYNCYIMSDWVDACASESTSPLFSNFDSAR